MTYAQLTRRHLDQLSRLMPPEAAPYTCFVIEGQRAIPFVSTSAAQRYASRNSLTLHYTAYGIECTQALHPSTPHHDKARIQADRLYEDCLLVAEGCLIGEHSALTLVN